MDPLEKARQVLAIERRELERLEGRLGDTFTRAVDLALECLGRHGKIVVLGVGKSGHIGRKIAATLTSTGSRAVVLDSINALHGDLGIVDDGDLILALSYSGETDELLNVLPPLARFHVRIVAMTGAPHSTLGRLSDVCLDVSVEKEACPFNLAPTSSTTAMLALGDALAMVLLESRGFKREDFARFHPGGRLGRRLLLRVSDILRPTDRVAVAGPDAKVRDALRRMTDLRCGAVVVTDNDGRVSGIFTQGDFARQYQRDPTVGDRALGECMTADPVTIRADRPALEVLRLIEERRIDDVIVIDQNGRLAGMIDSQDLARHNLV